MRLNSKSIVIAGSLAALTLGMIGCHGQDPGSAGYMPPSTSVLPASAIGGMQPAKDHGKKDIDIKSNCGHALHIVIAGIVNCRFREKGYGNGTFTVTDKEQGIVTVSPGSGGKSTVFTIVGLVVGSGHLIWKDTKGRHFKMAVRVTL